MDQSKATAIIAKHGLTGIPHHVLLAALTEAYTEGRLDGALAAATHIATAGVDQQAQNADLSPRRQRLTADLEVGKQEHPDIDFSKTVYIKRTPYTIVGYNRNAPKHAFIIEGPQGGRYKCPKSMIVAGQNSLR